MWHSSGADDLVGEEGPRAEWPSCLRLQWRLGRRAEAGAERERACSVRLVRVSVRVLVYVQCTCAVHAQCPCSACAVDAQWTRMACAERTGEHQLSEQRAHAHQVLLASSHVLRPGPPALVTPAGRREHAGTKLSLEIKHILISMTKQLKFRHLYQARSAWRRSVDL